MNPGVYTELLSSLQQLGNAIAGLSTLAKPVVNTVTIYAQTLFLAAGDRVKEANTFNKTTVA
jgi:hypothetical protein